jgi:hypothetical protein
MTTAMRIPATKKRVPMDSMRKTALVAGVFYLITFISIPALALYGPVKNHRDWILGSGGQGFKPSPITAGMAAADTAPAYHDVTA